jgi:hypothetical protein
LEKKIKITSGDNHETFLKELRSVFILKQEYDVSECLKIEFGDKDTSEECPGEGWENKELVVKSKMDNTPEMITFAHKTSEHLLE